MSQLLQGLAVDGKIPAIDRITAPAYYKGGLPFDAEGALSVTLNGIVDHHHQGLPFTVQNRLAVQQGVLSYFGNGAAPFASSGLLLVGVSAPVDFLAGVGYDVLEAICMDIYDGTGTRATVDAGGDYSGTVGVPVALNGVITPGTDPTPAALWQVIQASGPVTFTNQNAATTTATFGAAGSYQLALIAVPDDTVRSADTTRVEIS